MRKIAHIINPVIVQKNSDLFEVQPITFQALKVAREFAKNKVDISLYSAQFSKDRPLVPEGWDISPDLTRSVLDFGKFTETRNLPLLKDILDRLYQATEAEYLVYSNVDIAPLPHFYVTINAIIDKGFDSFVVNRRTIKKQFRKEELTLMYAEIGEPHPGHDCFVFRRDAYPNFKLGAVCLGVPFVGRVLIWNLICYSNRFKEFKDLHLTFHIGNDKIWKLKNFQDYVEFNYHESVKVFKILKAQNDGFLKGHIIYQYLSGSAPPSFRSRIRKKLRECWRRFKK